MQDNLNKNINNQNEFIQNTNSSLLNSNQVNSINVPTSNIQGEVTANKNALYLKIALFVFIFILLISVLFYFLSSKKSIIPGQNNQSSFPSLNLGTNLGGETYVDNNSNNSNTGDLGGEGDDDLKEVSHIWPKSIAGYNLIKLIAGTTTENSILFMDKETGNIYKTLYPSLETIRLTNTTLQNISFAAFSKNADFVSVLKGSGPYYKLISSRLGSEPDSSFSESEVDNNVVNLISSKIENIFYYLKSEENNTTSINSFSPSLGKISRLGEVRFSDIFISGEDKQNIYISSKPSSNIKQLTVILSKKNNTFNYVNGANNNKYGSDDSIIKENSGLVSVSAVDNNKNSNFTLKSFADKCSNLRGIYLVCGVDDTASDEFRISDYWYSGKISFTDSLSFLKISDGETTFIPVSLISGEPLDTYNLNSADDFLTFQNKSDDSLWLVDLVSL